MTTPTMVPGNEPAERTRYNARDHVIRWSSFDKRKNTNVTIEYYPAAWRLYELRLRWPKVTIESEIVYMNEEKNFVVVKATIYNGRSYDEADLRASSMKQGLLSSLDRIETAAKARAARDFGVSTELALDMDDEDDIPEVAPAAAKRPVTSKQQQATADELNDMYLYAIELGLITDRKAWDAMKYTYIGQNVLDANMTTAQIAKLKVGLAAERKKAMKNGAQADTQASAT